MNRLSRFEILVAETKSSMAASDCDCACALALPALASTGVPADTFAERHPQQRTLALRDGYSVAFVPSASRVAVVNEATLDLLLRFDAPQPIDAGGPDALEAAQQLLRLGLLRPYGQADQSPPPADELVAWL